MKKTIVLLLLTFLFSACKRDYTCNDRRPANLKPIDWENYNDVHTVFWNGVQDCSEASVLSVMGKGYCYDSLKNIKVYGWIRHCIYFSNCNPPINPEQFTLSEEEYISECDGAKGTILYIKAYSCTSDTSNSYEHHNELIDSLKIKFANTDITKKCYISGRLSYNQTPDNNCCFTIPIILIHSADDVKFEEE